MNDLNIIYYDMDGVLADFDRGVIELLKIPPVDQANHTAEQDDEMFAKMKECGHFYDKLEPLPGAVELFREVYEKYGDRCRILSGIPKPERGIDSAADDKRSWVKRLLPEGVIVYTVRRAEKQKFAHEKGDILIDDFVRNIREWENSGGTGILCRNAEDLRVRLQEMGIL